MKRQNANVKVPIPENVYLRWKLLYQFGDFAKIAKEAGVAPHIAQRMFSEKKGTPDLIKSANKFFNAKSKVLNEGIRSLSTLEMAQ